MSGYFQLYAATGQSGAYMIAKSMTTGQVWNGSSMEAWNQSHWADYVISAPEDAGSGCYQAAIPGALPADIYKVALYIPNGSPAAGDPWASADVFQWSGSAPVWLRSGVNVSLINGDAVAASNLGISAKALVAGAASAGTLSTSQMTTTLADTVANIYSGRILTFTSGVNKGLSVLITAYAVTGGRLTFIAYGNLPAPAAPSAADTFIIS